MSLYEKWLSKVNITKQTDGKKASSSKDTKIIKIDKSDKVNSNKSNSNKSNSNKSKTKETKETLEIIATPNKVVKTTKTEIALKDEKTGIIDNDEDGDAILARERSDEARIGREDGINEDGKPIRSKFYENIDSKLEFYKKVREYNIKKTLESVKKHDKNQIDPTSFKHKSEKTKIEILNQSSEDKYKDDIEDQVDNSMSIMLRQKLDVYDENAVGDKLTDEEREAIKKKLDKDNEILKTRMNERASLIATLKGNIRENDKKNNYSSYEETCAMNEDESEDMRILASKGFTDDNYVKMKHGNYDADYDY
jgi:hypothetical protein